MIASELYRKFCTEEFNVNGVLLSFTPKCEDNFTFAYDVVDEMARIAPDKRALVWCNERDEEKIFSFGDISRLSNKAANMFTRAGIKRGDFVLLILKRHWQFWIAVTALNKIGAIAVPATNQLKQKDIEYRVSSAGITAVVCTADGDVSSGVEGAEQKLSIKLNKFIVNSPREGWNFFDELMADCADTFERVAQSKNDPMLMYFTSGTSGMPKMVLHMNTYPIGHIITAKYWQCARPDGLHLTVSDSGWAKAAWGKIYGQWLTGCAVFVYDFDTFDAAKLLGKVAQYGVTTFCAPPTIYRFMIKEDMKQYNLSSLRYAATAGEALNSEVYNKFYRYTGLRIMEAFGQTETTPVIANLKNSIPKSGSMGKPSPLFNVRLLDAEGDEVEPGVVGEISVKYEGQVGLFSGYYKDEALTEQSRRKGYYGTGDTAWRDEDGYYWYVGRKDDIIKSSGYRIGPFEIESVLMQHPSVLECAVTGAPHPDRGQVIKATIVLAKGYTASDELTKELQNFVKRLTAPYKYPRIIEYVAELPKTFSGKIKRAELRGK